MDLPKDLSQIDALTWIEALFEQKHKNWVVNTPSINDFLKSTALFFFLILGFSALSALSTVSLLSFLTLLSCCSDRSFISVFTAFSFLSALTFFFFLSFLSECSEFSDCSYFPFFSFLLALLSLPGFSALSLLFFLSEHSDCSECSEYFDWSDCSDWSDSWDFSSFSSPLDFSNWEVFLLFFSEMKKIAGTLWLERAFALEIQLFWSLILFVVRSEKNSLLCQKFAKFYLLICQNIYTKIPDSVSIVRFLNLKVH